MTTICSLEMPKLNEAQRVMNTFTAPSLTMRDILRSQKWWVPFLITVTLSYAFSLTAIRTVGVNQLVENNIQASPTTMARMKNLQPAQRAASRMIAERTFEISMALEPLLVLAFNGIMGLTLWASLNLMLGNRVPFGSIFAVLMYADLIQNIKPILSMILLIAGVHLSGFNIGNPIGSNPGFFLGTNASPGLRAFLTSIDFVTIWYLAVITVGCATVGRLRIRQATVIVYGWWFLLVFIRVAWSVLAS